MKKFVILESIGTWEMRDGKTIINCTVKAHRIVAEANTAQELTVPAKEYRSDGTWHYYTLESRKWAKAWMGKS